MRGRATQRLQGREAPEDPKIPWGGGDTGPGRIVEVWAVSAWLRSSLACELVNSICANVASRSGSSLLHIAISIFPDGDLILLDLPIPEIFTMPATGSPKKAAKGPKSHPMLRKVADWTSELEAPKSPAKVPRTQAGDGDRVASPRKGSGSKHSDLKTDETKPGLDAPAKPMKAKKAYTTNAIPQ